MLEVVEECGVTRSTVRWVLQLNEDNWLLIERNKVGNGIWGVYIISTPYLEVE